MLLEFGKMRIHRWPLDVGNLEKNGFSRMLKVKVV
jgi:hypothetical protein